LSGIASAIMPMLRQPTSGLAFSWPARDNRLGHG
jgi:hypothetical protein